MDAFLNDWSYLGVFLTIVATGMGLPLPEEVPVVAGGALVAGAKATWWVMLPVCIVAVVIGDSALYFAGRFWGAKLVQVSWIKNTVLPPDRLEKISENFQKYGIKILLFARLTPGIRTPIFLTAGIARLPLTRFLIADGIYAVPGVTLLFVLGYYFTDTMVNLVREKMEIAKAVVILTAVIGVAIYFAFRWLRRPMVTGNPHEMPKLVEQVTHGLESVTQQILHPGVPLADPNADGNARESIGTSASSTSSPAQSPSDR